MYSLKEHIKEDISIFYNCEEFAKECLYKSKKVSVLFAKNELELFSDVKVKRVCAKATDFDDICESDILQIDNKKYIVINYSFEKDLQISIELKELE